jgi:hypothetical protein
MRPDLPFVQAEEVEQTVITDCTTGVTTVVGGRVTTISADPLTGAKRRVTTTTKIRSTDGRVLDTSEQVYECRCGRPVLSKHSVVFCKRCEIPVCLTCARGVADHHLCRSCWWATLPLRFFSWLRNV